LEEGLSANRAAKHVFQSSPCPGASSHYPAIHVNIDPGTVVEKSSMKAIVLSYDKQVGLAELVVKSYLRLWKECPFQFMVPQNDDSSPHFDFLAKQKNVTLVRAPSSVRQTMSALLDGLDDNAWVYWCIDDRYPVEIDQPRIEMVFDFIASGAAEGLNGIKLTHWRETADTDRKDIWIGDRRFRFQVPHTTWGFWHHQFLKVKVLKEFFIASGSIGLPDSPPALNIYFHQLPMVDVFKSIVVPPEEPIVQFGETLLDGKLLENAFKALVEYTCPVPPYKRDSRTIFFNGPSSWEAVAALKGELPAQPRPGLKGVLQTVRSWVQRQ
jgi:hypothetical protein